MNVFSRDALWQKAKLYAGRMVAAEPGDLTYGLWATLALEFLARSTIASVHPVLVADPSEPQYLLYAFGYRTDRAPRSIPAKAIFARCEALIPEFTDAERRFAMGLIERRNAELHSGEPAFHDHPSSDWVAEYYRVCTVLLRFQNRQLGHLIGGEEAKTARKLVKAAESNVRGKVLAEVAHRREEFGRLAAEDQASLRRDAGLRARAESLGHPLSQRTRCPSCNAFATRSGQRVRSGEPIAEEEQVVIKTVVLPTRFRCFACDLRLVTHPELHFAGVGDQFTVDEYSDPSDFYSLYQPEPDYYDEYMNE